MRIRLASKWDWKVPGRRAVMAWPAGDYTMTHAQGEAAIAEGVGTEIKDEPPKRKRPRGPAN
jgi:hypothetical protein